MARKAGHIWFFFAKATLFIIVLGIFFIGQIIFYKQTVFYFWGNYIVLLLYTINLYFTNKIYQGFNFGSVDWQEIFLSWVLSLILTNILQYLMLSLLSNQLLSVIGFLVVFAIQLVLIIPTTLVIRKLYYRINPAQKAIVIYKNEGIAHEYCSIIEKHRDRFKISKIVAQDEPLEALFHQIEEAESVFILDLDEEYRETILEYCYMHNKRIYIQPTFSGVMLYTASTAWISNTPMFLPKNPMLDPVQLFFKRCMDIVISLVAIILASWLMLIIWAAIRIEDHGPAIYKQTRVTKDGKLFTLYKFRSMKPDAEADGVPRLASKDDIRITATGRILRKTRLDELPQFFNVLSGKMSLVGPRPERPEIAKEYEEKYPYFSIRTKIKAGITGYAQIYGKYSTAPDEKLFLDVIYIEKFSIWQDIKLLLQTLRVILIPTGAEGL